MTSLSNYGTRPTKQDYEKHPPDPRNEHYPTTINELDADYSNYLCHSYTYSDTAPISDHFNYHYYSHHGHLDILHRPYHDQGDAGHDHSNPCELKNAPYDNNNNKYYFW